MDAKRDKVVKKGDTFPTPFFPLFFIEQKCNILSVQYTIFRLKERNVRKKFNIGHVSHYFLN